ncbi:MAG: glycosyltransferase family 9 protein, partial [Acidobacteriota bacterium]
MQRQSRRRQEAGGRRQEEGDGELGTGERVQGPRSKAAERPIAEQVRGLMQMGSRLHVLSGKTSLASLAGVMAWCDCFVTNDTGSMHLAA